MDAYTAGFIGGIIMGLLIGAIGVLFVGAIVEDRERKIEKGVGPS